MNPALRYLTASAWALEPSVFAQLSGIVERHANGIRLTDAEIAIATGKAPRADDDGDGGDEDEEGGEAEMQVMGTTALIPIRGVIARYASQVNQISQPQGRSADSMQADMKAVMGNPDIKSVVLCIDSPGGTVAGTSETAAMIRAMSASGKHVVAYVDGLAASAAYWLASQADEIICSSPTAQVGSIGVITAYVDSTKAQDQRGYRVHVVRSVALKAPGTANESLNVEQLSSIQRTIDDLHEAFVQVVAAGRGLDGDALDAATTGEVFTAARAQSMGMIDGIESLDAVLSRVASGMGATEKLSLVRTALGWASHAAPKEHNMAKSLEQLAALIEKHPTRAVMISALAAKDSTEDAILAAIAAADASDKLAGLESAVKSKDEQIAALTVERDAEKAKAVAAESARVEIKAQHDALAALKAGADEGKKVKVDGAPPKQSPKAGAKDYESMSGLEKAAFHREGGTVSGE